MYQIFSSNTNVGKTIFSAGLLGTAARRLKQKGIESSSDNFSKLFYLKPVQTGYPVDSDARFVEKVCMTIGGKTNFEATTLYKYQVPASPHIAADEPPIDQNVLNVLKSRLTRWTKSLNGKQGLMLLETAGGVNSPMMSGTLQSDFYRKLRLPTILVGDGNLGGISSTISAYETLSLHGYDILAVLLFDHDMYKNFPFLKEYFRMGDCLVEGFPVVPRKRSNAQVDYQLIKKYFNKNQAKFENVLDYLEQQHAKRFDRLESMEDKTKSTIWWPFTQHQRVKQVTVIDSAFGDYLTTYSRNKSLSSADESGQNTNTGFIDLYDGCASWWTQGLGHGSPTLTKAASYAAGRYGHIMFPGCTHEPALALSEKLLETVGKNWAQRVFFSDNGSTAMEIALKMALQVSALRMNMPEAKDIDILGLDGCYHGDTIGVMDACGPNIFNKRVTWYKPRGYWFEPPTILMKNGVYNVDIPTAIMSSNQNSVVKFSSLKDIFDLKRDNSSMANLYKKHISSIFEQFESNGRKFGGLLMEPVLMGAAGMLFVDPLFQRTLVNMVRQWQNLPVIFDEVFTGIWRLGQECGGNFLGVKPDIAAYAKLLTGGLVPLATTLATEEIFNEFLSNNKANALLHGHSYTAHPVGCLVACASMQEFEKLENSQWKDAKHKWNIVTNNAAMQKDEINPWSVWNPEMVETVSSLPNVKGAFALGSVFAVHLKDSQTGYMSDISQSILGKLQDDIHDVENDLPVFARSLGNVLYLMTSQITTSDEVQRLEKRIINILQEF